MKLRGMMPFVLIPLIGMFQWESIVGTLYFSYLCVFKEKKVVNATARDVEGYLKESGEPGCGINCVISLHRRVYDFIEVRVEKANRRFLTAEPGLHRFSLVRSPTEACRLYETEYANSRLGLSPSWCVASTRVDQPQARFKEFYKYQVNHTLLGTFSEERVIITEIATGHALADGRRYLYVPDTTEERGAEATQRPKGRTCSANDESRLYVENVLVPKQR